MNRALALARVATAIGVCGWVVSVGVQSGAATYHEGGGYDGARFTYEAHFTSKKPARATGFVQAIDYVNPDDPAAKPPAIAQVHILLPKGARIDPTAVPACAASDLELILAGAAACPVETRVGSGTLTADTGGPGEGGDFPRTIETEVSFFNGGDDLTFVAETTNTVVPLRIPSHFVVGKRSFTSSVPPLPGAPPPDPFLAIDEITNSLERVVSASGAYITTPPRCPAKRRWRFTAEVTYRDGVVQTERSVMRCRPGAERR